MSSIVITVAYLRDYNFSQYRKKDIKTNAFNLK